MTAVAVKTDVFDVVKTYRYKLNPTSEHANIFSQWLGTCRYVYNLAKEYRDYFTLRKVSVLVSMT